MKGKFVISLDFELYWGISDKIVYDEYRGYFDRTLQAIPKILDIMVKYDIHCTWATVGMLWNENWEEWTNNIPVFQPAYNNTSLSNYHSISLLKNIAKNEAHFFALEYIKRIANTNHQEIASHTYSHFYCNEPPFDKVSFEADLLKTSEMAKKLNVNLPSIVLPRNQFVEETLQLLFDNGFTSVRTNPNVWYWKLNNLSSLSSRVARIIDAYLPFFSKKSYPIDSIIFDHGVVCQPASRFLRPPVRSKMLNQMRIKRIKSEMTHAAKNNRIYHLWWHPHNFAPNMNISLAELTSIFRHYENLNRQYGMESINMQELVKLVRNHG